ncbi:LysR family transcriptional regulator [Pendulispora rubella]|uniref:LysR family transcriptional regulator n=1 Tax=Pendulispora rubella TaxID=2741070 RepID=A0ABZ2LBV9_9BACT
MHSIDANLLLALDALLREGSVLGAARRMNLSPPAMSRTLARLREATGDALFVRAGHRMVPTPRALALRERVRAAADEVQSILRPDEPLDLTKLDRAFTIRANDYLSVAVGDAFDAIAGKEAPRVRVAIIPEGPGAEDDAPLRAGELDLDIGVQSGFGPEMRIQTLYRDQVVAIVRADHRLTRKRLTPERFATAAGHIGISRRGKAKGPIDAILADLGLQRRVERVFPSYLAAAWAAANSDRIAIAPDRLAQRIAPVLGLRILAIPFPLDPITIAQSWHPRFDGDPAHTWLRHAMRRAFEAHALR